MQSCKLVGLVIVLACASVSAIRAQDEVEPAPPAAEGAAPRAEAKEPQPPKEVSVAPVARDDEIGERLQGILEATGWFEHPSVSVDEGVVFLQGTAADPEYRSWAGKLATSTQDVVAVVNKMEVAKPVVWDIRPALDGLTELWTGLLRSLPFIGFGLVILLATLVAARATRRLSRRLFARSVEVPLLRDVIARACGLAVLVVGLYIVLRVSGLTRLALTVVGGTGLVGLVIGIAFRDIAENFLASILLSVQRPFRSGDLVQIGEVTGLVDRLNVRTTIIMTLDGNHAQIPNATVYKSVIRNFTSNPNRRDEFVVGISYDSSIAAAQDVALGVLAEHPMVLRDPEPWVLVDRLGAATVDLRVYFWLDGLKDSPPKVRSSVIRQIMSAYHEAGITIPDSAREVVFPLGVPIRMIEGNGTAGQSDNGGEGADRGARTSRSRAMPRANVEEPIMTRAEGKQGSETDQIEEQARQAPPPEPGADLLPDDASASER
jgi:small conductance mechanosensitive channel